MKGRMQNAECRMGKTSSTPHAPAATTRQRGESRLTLHAPRSTRAFTMIEIAISLAVIGFALVAVIGILPTAMNVQKQNRQETIVNQDAVVLLDAIRNGQRGLDDLTNYVAAITNSVSLCDNRGFVVVLNFARYGYTYNGSFGTPQPMPLNTGSRIIGLLSTPKYIPQWQGQPPRMTYSGFLSNHVVAYMRGMSGSASDQVPAYYPANQNPVQNLAFGLAFSYRLIPEVTPWSNYLPDWTNYTAYPPNSVDWTWRSNYWVYATPTLPNHQVYMPNLPLNTHELRLTFRWPLLPNGDSGPNRQVFRAEASGGLLTWTNEFSTSPYTYYPQYAWPAVANVPANVWGNTLFFFQPRSYLQVQTP
jgi:type II secretory pathway pseudopilin PulG